MSARPEIPAVEGVQDKQVAGILGAMKNIIEMITGRSPIRPQIALLGPNAGLAAMTNKINEVIARLQSTDSGGATTAPVSGTGILSNSLVADVALTDVSLYFDGPSVKQGSSGIWFVSGQVTVTDANVGGGNISCKLWDGTTVIDSAFGSASSSVAIPLSGFISSPTGNLRISVKDASNAANANIKFSLTGNTRDSTITALRVG